MTAADLNVIKRARILLCSVTKLKDFACELQKMSFTRIIFDEVQTTGNHAARKIPRMFTWLLSATYQEVFRRGLDPWLITFGSSVSVAIQCADHFIDSSIALPAVEKVIYTCEDTWIIATLLSSAAVPRSAMQALKADDISEAVRTIGGGATTPVELIHEIISGIKKKTTLLEQTLQSHESALAAATDAEMRGRLSAQLTQATKRRESLRVQQACLEERVKSVPDEHCPICFDPMEPPMFMKCCGNFVCLECVTTIIRGACKCPMCREAIDFDKMTLLVTDEKRRCPERDPRTKKERVLKILEEGKGKSFLVFSNHDGALRDIESAGVGARRLQGTGATVQKLISDQIAGRLPVLLVNSRHLGSGLNLQHVDEVIIYHDVGRFIETQVVGRVCRLGRKPGKPPIKVHQLLYASEMEQQRRNDQESN